MTDNRYSPVRFTRGPLGVVRADDPNRFVERTVTKGDTGELIVEGELPFTIPDGWLLVVVDFDEELYAPVHESMIEAVTS